MAGKNPEEGVGGITGAKVTNTREASIVLCYFAVNFLLGS